MKNYKAKDVDAYIAGADKKARPKLKELRKMIRSAVPKAEESISWGIPFYKYRGLLAGFAVFNSHVSFGLVAALPGKIRTALEKKGYATGKKIVQIGFDQKTPAAMIKQILKARAKMNEAKNKTHETK